MEINHKRVVAIILSVAIMQSSSGWWHIGDRTTANIFVNFLPKLCDRLPINFQGWLMFTRFRNARVKIKASVYSLLRTIAGSDCPAQKRSPQQWNYAHSFQEIIPQYSTRVDVKIMLETSQNDFTIWNYYPTSLGRSGLQPTMLGCNHSDPDGCCSFERPVLPRRNLPPGKRLQSAI
jgi:hypothetical protein